jgi:hypothetical protein
MDRLPDPSTEVSTLSPDDENVLLPLMAARSIDDNWSFAYVPAGILMFWTLLSVAGSVWFSVTVQVVFEAIVVEPDSGLALVSAPCVAIFVMLTAYSPGWVAVPDLLYAMPPSLAAPAAANRPAMSLKFLEIAVLSLVESTFRLPSCANVMPTWVRVFMLLFKPSTGVPSTRRSCVWIERTAESPCSTPPLLVSGS